MCTDRLDVLQEVFGADYRTSMIGKTIEVQGKPEGLCWGQAGEIQIFLARQVRPVQSAQFAAGTQVWVPPVRYAPPSPPPPTRAENDAAVLEFAKVVAEDRQRRARGRLTNACATQSSNAFAANPGNVDAINKEHAACIGRVGAEVQREGQRAQECAIQAMKGDPRRSGRDPDGFYRDVDACMGTP